MRFRFDTVDDAVNDFRGWFVDDIQVVGAGSITPVVLSVTNLAFASTGTPFTLNPGSNEITVTATNGYPTPVTGSATVTVIRDATAPVVSLNTLVDVTNTSTLTISGSSVEATPKLLQVALDLDNDGVLEPTDKILLSDKTFDQATGVTGSASLTVSVASSGGGGFPAPAPTATSAPAAAPPPPAPALQSLAVTPAGETIAVGENQQYTATGSFANGSSQNITANVTWVSSNSSIATINAAGLATGVAEGIVTISATDPNSGLSSSTTLTVISAEALQSAEQTVTVDTTITVSTEEVNAASEAASAALEEDVTITGDLDITLGNLTLDSTDGTGTAVIDLGGGLSIEGDATLEVTAQGINVEIAAPRLVLKPEVPDATVLLGGSASVTEISVDFSVELENLPSEASLSVQFAKDPSAFLSNPGATFQLAASNAGGSLVDPVGDITFVVNVTKSGITNQDLGTNTITMTVSRAWYDQKLAESKDIYITKIDDQNNDFSVIASCNVSGDPVICTADFSGVAGGFSLFVLYAIAPAPTPTPTRTPPTTTPTGGTDAHAGSTDRNASGHDIASHGNANGRAHHNAHGCCTTSLSDTDTDTYDCSRSRAHADTGSWGGGRCARIPYRHYRRHGASRRRGRRILLPGDEA